MQGVMILRVSVIWRYKRLVVNTLCTSLALEVISLALIQGYAGRVDTNPSKLRVYRATCAPNYPSDWYFLMWLPILAFECVMLVAVMRRAMQMCPIRNPEIIKLLNGSKPSLMQVMMRDSIMFPIAALFICVVNFLGWLILPVWFARVAVTMTAFTARTLGCRLVLNLRDQYYRPFEDEYMHSVPPSQPITFEQDSISIPLSPTSPTSKTRCFSMNPEAQC
ncbi:hypothetical protein BJ165DRAFT_1481977 [Panaeolus papilionaceus]|nr:hypothetical protein BJ165DRAFT_1481977 [Panaeolus papilionaceus]